MKQSLVFLGLFAGLAMSVAASTMYDPMAMDLIAIGRDGRVSDSNERVIKPSMVVVGARRREFKLGDAWYGLGDNIGGEWIVEKIEQNQVTVKKHHLMAAKQRN